MSSTFIRLRELFEQCMDLPEGERERWLDQNVPDDDQRLELELMLVADSGVRGFLQRDVVSYIGMLGEVIAQEFEPQSLIGKRYGAFELRRLIGRGGQGAVYLAQRVGHDFAQTAAVKLLRRGFHDSVEHRRFRREREILARLEHAGIARLIDGGVSEEGVPYLVMEYVDGLPIDDWCTQHQLDRRARLDLFVQLCDVVTAAHRALVVHRDLKPSNVLITPAGEVKVLDFGIARLLDEDDAHTQTVVPLMTPGYGAPEQVHGGAITLATDVHALGVLLRVLLTGATPDRADYASTPVLPDSVPKELHWIIGKACASEAQHRYRDATELRDDITRFLDARPVLAHPPSRLYTTSKFIRRYRGGVAITLTVVLGVLASAAAALWQAKVAREQAQRAEAARGFLLSVFEAARQDLPKNARPTPDVLVRMAAKKLDGDSRLPPVLRAEFLGTLGAISYSSNDYTQAVDYADRAIATLRVIGETDTRQHLRLEVARAEALVHLDRHLEADRALEPRVDLILAQDDDVAVDGARVYSATRLHSGQLDDALRFAHEAAERARRVYGPKSDKLEEAILSHGHAMLNAGQTQKAITLFEARRAAWNSNHPTQDRNYAALLGNLAVLKTRVGDLDAAEHLMRESLQLTRSIFEPPHEDIAMALLNLGGLLASRGRYDEAQSLLRESATMFTSVFGSNHSQTISVLGMQGAVENKRGRYAEALPLLLRATSACTDAGLDSEPTCAYNLHYLSLAYLKLGRLDEAEAAGARNLALLLKLYGDKNPDYAKALITKADIFIARDQSTAALALLDEALGIFSRHGQAGNLSGVNIHTARAKALARLKRPAEALDAVDRADTLIRRLAPNDEGRRLDLLAVRADILSQMGRADDARETARAALKLESVRATISEKHWQRIETLSR